MMTIQRATNNVVIELRQTSLAERLLLGETSTALLALASSMPAAAAAWLLWLPGHLFSREMTWDLLFNLEGAWYIEHGHVPHVGFHEPLGRLGFGLTALGFRFVGYTPIAFLIGELIVLVVILAAAVPVAARRLAPVPALLFVVYETLLILLPANIGSAPNAYSFAMSYNRWGWAALALLCLLLFVAPRPRRDTRWELVVALMLAVFLFYLKITVAAGAIAALVLATAIVGRVRQRWPWWMGVVGAIVLVAAAPMNHAYLAETWAYATAGSVRVDLLHVVNIVVEDRAEYALYSAMIGLLFWLWQSGRAPSEAVLSAVVLAGLGVAVLTQNAQKADIPLGIVMSLLTYNTLAGIQARSLPSASRAPLVHGLPIILLVALIWPALSVGAAVKVFAGYYAAATSSDVLRAPPNSNLRGLAVPPLDRRVPNALGRMGYEVLSSTRPSPIGDPIAQAEYLEALLEAAATLAGRSQKVLVLDQVNPMPFVLGYPPPRGSELWMGADVPRRSAQETFGDVDVVLVPKYSTYPATTALILSMHEEYLRHHFPVRSETPRWTFLRRSNSTTPR